MVAGRFKGDGKGRIGGRQKGTPNKKTSELRARINQFAQDNYEEVIAAWERIPDPEKKVKAYVELLKYVLPTLSSVQIKDSTEEDTTQKYLNELSKDEND